MISRGRFMGLLILAAVLVAVVIALGFGPRLRHEKTLAAETATEASRPPRSAPSPSNAPLRPPVSNFPPICRP